MTEKHARYLINPDTDHVELVVADQVEEKQKSGWGDPIGMRPNGYVYNRDEDQLVTDAAGKALEDYNKRKEEKSKKNAEEQPKSDKESINDPVKTSPSSFSTMAESVHTDQSPAQFRENQ